MENPVSVAVSSREMNLEEHDKQNDSAAKKKKLIIASVIIGSVIIICVCVILIVVLLKKNKNKNKSNYSIMIDAGSSSTRFYTYIYKKESKNSFPVLEEKFSSSKFKPGISESTDLNELFSKVLEQAVNNINEISNSTADLNKVPIYSMATAGVRKLNITAQNTIISGIREILKNSSFLFKNDSWARVISGVEESYYGWVAINYITNIIQNNENKKSKINQTIGSLDMGGSSIEISFIPNDNEIKDNKINLKLGILNYDIFSTVVNGYGQDDTLLKINTYSVTKNNNNNPCYLSGYSEKYSEDDTITIQGTGNYAECDSLIVEIINEIKTKYTYFPSTSNVKFIAMSAFTYTSSFLGVSETEYSSPDDLLTKTYAFCIRNQTDVKNEYPNEGDDYLKKYCFAGIYCYHFLVDLLNFKKDEKTILFSNKINGMTPSWSLGAMAYELGLLAN